MRGVSASLPVRGGLPSASLEFGPQPQADRPWPPGNNLGPGANAAHDQPRQLVALVEDVGCEQLDIVILPVEAGEQIGFPGVPMARMLGAILLACTALYLFPRTSVLGAILLTAYLYLIYWRKPHE